MISIEKLIQEACDLLFAQRGLITHRHIYQMEQRVEGFFIGRGYDVSCTVTLEDENEAAVVYVHHGEQAAKLILKWQRADGTYVARIDTDGDGK